MTDLLFFCFFDRFLLKTQVPAGSLAFLRRLRAVRESDPWAPFLCLTGRWHRVNQEMLQRFFPKAVAAQWCNPQDGTAIPRYLRYPERGTIIVLCRSLWSVWRACSEVVSQRFLQNGCSWYGCTCIFTLKKITYHYESLSFISKYIWQQIDVSICLNGTQDYPNAKIQAPWNLCGLLPLFHFVVKVS